MNPLDILTLLIALWGALLSTILFYREFIKDKRSVIVYLDFVHKHETFNLRILNLNHRPIAIVGAEINIYPDSKKKPERIPINKLEDNDENIDFPFTLNDGEYKVIPLPKAFRDIVYKSIDLEIKKIYKENKLLRLLRSLSTIKHYRHNGKFEIYVLDAEGKRYIAKRGNDFNPRFDYIIK